MRSAAAQPDFAAWASLPLIPFDRGYVQTIADLAEDRRLIIIYQADGSIASTLALDVPMGLAFGTTAPARIYGARRTDELEIVGYSYQWGRPQ